MRFYYFVIFWLAVSSSQEAFLHHHLYSHPGTSDAVFFWVEDRSVCVSYRFPLYILLVSMTDDSSMPGTSL
jgi:hypothetical protein